MFNMILSNYSMPDSSKLNSSTASSRKSTKKTEKIKEKPPSPKKEPIDKELEASIISKKELEEQEQKDKINGIKRKTLKKKRSNKEIRIKRNKQK